MSNVTQLLQDLIRIPSVNPDAEPEAAPNGERLMAEHLEKLLSSHGFLCTLEEVLPNRPNIIARAPYDGGTTDETSERNPPTDENLQRKPIDPRPRILLGPHLDTVSIKGMTIDPYSAEIRNGKIWGRGSSDTKGPMAAMITGLINNADLLSILPVAVDFVGFCGEESSQPGAKHFAKHHAAEYDFAIAGEPTSLEAVHCTKGSLWATLQTTGKACHSSQPHLGDNAILKLTHALHQLLSALEPHLEAATHPILGHSTHNLGTINGGTLANIVPDHARAQLDLRTTPTLVKESGTAEHFLRKQIEKLDLPLEITHLAESPPMDTPIDHPWLQRLQSIHPNMPLVGAPWFSDAAHLNALGLPSICLGPGSIDQAHTKDEFISIEDLENGADFFTHFIKNLQT